VAIFREQDGESVGCLFYIKFSKLEYIIKNRESLGVALIITYCSNKPMKED
jgi:hypothetical protein